MSSDTNAPSVDTMRQCGPLRFGIDAILAVTKSLSPSPNQDRPLSLLSPKQDIGSPSSPKQDIGSSLKPKQASCIGKIHPEGFDNNKSKTDSQHHQNAVFNLNMRQRENNEDGSGNRFLIERVDFAKESRQAEVKQLMTIKNSEQRAKCGAEDGLDLIRNNENTAAALFGEDDVDIDSGLDSDESREGFNVREDCKAVAGPPAKRHKRAYYAIDEDGFRRNNPKIEDRISAESEVQRNLFVKTHSQSAAVTNFAKAESTLPPVSHNVPAGLSRYADNLSLKTRSDSAAMINFATAESTPLPEAPIIPAGPYTVRPSTAQDSVRQPSIVQPRHPRSSNSVSSLAGLSSTARTELSSIAHTELSSIARAAQLSHIFRESSFQASSIPHTGQLNLDIIRSASTIQASIAQAYALNVLSQLRPQQSTVCPWTSEVPKVDSSGFAASPGGSQLSQESAEVADSSIYPSWPSLHRDRYGVVRRIGHPYQNRTPPKRKKPRTSFSRSQIVELEKRFHRQKYLASAERSSLAKQLKMTDAQVKTWFQNRRTKWRRQTAEEREMERREANKFLFSLREDETV